MASDKYLPKNKSQTPDGNAASAAGEPAMEKAAEENAAGPEDDDEEGDGEQWPQDVEQTSCDTGKTIYHYMELRPRVQCMELYVPLCECACQWVFGFQVCVEPTGFGVAAVGARRTAKAEPAPMSEKSLPRVPQPSAAA